MNQQNRVFESMSVWRSIAQMAVPAMVSMLVMVLYNMADLFFVGQLGDNAQVAAVSIVGPVFNMLMALGSMLGGGGCALIARTLGEGDTQKVRLYSSLSCWGGILLGILFGAVALAAQDPLLLFLGANDQIVEYARAYLSILAMGAPFMVFTTTFSGILRAEGAVKDSMIGYLLSTLVNLALDPLFILVMQKGVGGAALATVIGNVVGSVYLAGYCLRGKTSLTLSPVYAIREPLAFWRIVEIGLPNFTSSTLVGFANALANQMLVGYGTAAVAAMSAAGKSRMILSMVQMGITTGVQPLLAYHYGTGNLPRLRETLRKTSLLTILLGLVMTGFCLLNGRMMVALFLKEPSALELGKRMLYILVLSGPFLGLYYISTSFLQAGGRAGAAAFTSVLRQGILFVPLIYMMNALFAVEGNIWAHLVSDVASAVVSVVLAMLHYRKLKRTWAQKTGGKAGEITGK